jgi:NADPH-dependent curcumin reductase CurA
MVSSKVIVLANPPNRGNIQSDTFGVETRDLASPSKGQVLLKVLALGNEPAQKTWMDTEIDPKRLYAPPIQKGEVVRAPAIGEVVESGSDKWSKGQRVTGMFGWREYALVDEKEITGVAA